MNWTVFTSSVIDSVRQEKLDDAKEQQGNSLSYFRRARRGRWPIAADRTVTEEVSMALIFLPLRTHRVGLKNATVVNVIF